MFMADESVASSQARRTRQVGDPRTAFVRDVLAKGDAGLARILGA
jgi:hypothetical protein